MPLITHMERLAEAAVDGTPWHMRSKVKVRHNCWGWWGADSQWLQDGDGGAGPSAMQFHPACHAYCCVFACCKPHVPHCIGQCAGGKTKGNRHGRKRIGGQR